MPTDDFNSYVVCSGAMSHLNYFYPAQVDRLVWFSLPSTGMLVVRVKRRGWFVNQVSFKPGRAPSKAAVIAALIDPIEGGYFERCGGTELTGRVLGASRRRARK